MSTIVWPIRTLNTTVWVIVASGMAFGRLARDERMEVWEKQSFASSKSEEGEIRSVLGKFLCAAVSKRRRRDFFQFVR